MPLRPIDDCAAATRPRTRLFAHQAGGNREWKPGPEEHRRLKMPALRAACSLPGISRSRISDALQWTPDAMSPDGRGKVISLASDEGAERTLVRRDDLRTW